MARPGLESPAGRWAMWLAVPCAALALAIGFAVGNPSPETLAPAVVLSGLTVVVLSLARPFAAFLILAGSTFFLPVFDLPGGQGINPFDVLLPSVLLASMLGPARAEALAANRAIRDPGRMEIHRATRRFTRSVIAFYAIALLSLVAMYMSGRTEPLGDSTVSLTRAVQGLLLFPLGIWWLRSETRIHAAIRAVIVAGVVLAVVNTVTMAIGVTGRAGTTWFVNITEDVVGGPNEIAPAMLALGAMVLVRQSMAPRFGHVLMLVIAFAMLVASASRSGLLASAVFMAMVMPRTRWRWIVLASFVVLAAIPLIPDEYWTRLGRTLVMQRGTFEAYTSLIRVYCWKTAFQVFLHNPLLGVGYVAFSTVSGDYGELRLIGAPAENYLLETASGMGVPGVIALLVVLVRLFQLGAAVRREAPVGSLGHAIARYHTPLVIGLLVVSLTGDNFCSMVALGQLALWCAMLVRAGHLSLERASA